MQGGRREHPGSDLALDALNVFLADVRDGLGPFLAIYLTSERRWSPDRVGIAMAAMLVGTVLAQTPIGAFIDRTRRKRLAVALGAVVVAIGCVAMVAWPVFAVIVTSQAVIGAAAALFGPAVAAISLGLVGRKRMAARTGRNEAFNHAGNVATAALAGGAGYLFGYWAIFYLVALMAVFSAISVMRIRESDIDHDRARGADANGTPHVESVWSLLRDRRVMIFVTSAVLFHFANAAMLPLVGQKLTQGMDRGTSVLMSACIIAAQLVMIPVALLTSRLAETWGRKPVFLIGFAVLPIRGLLYTITTNPYALVAIQLLDGIGAGIFGVVSVLVIADLTKGTGRFNLTQGLLATATGLGAASSNVLSGYVVKAAGFDAGFLSLSALAAFGAFYFWRMMPETRLHEISPASSPTEPAGSSAAVVGV